MERELTRTEYVEDIAIARALESLADPCTLFGPNPERGGEGGQAG